MAKVPTRIPFDEKRKEVYLKHLRKWGNKSHAAMLTGCHPRTPLIHETKYPHFGEDVEDAIGEFLGVLEASAVEKAIQGKDKIVVSAGKVVMHNGEPLTEKQFSDGLHAQLLKANDPDKYRENRTVKNEGGGGVLVVTTPSPEDWQKRLDDMAKAQIEKDAADEATK